MPAGSAVDADLADPGCPGKSPESRKMVVAAAAAAAAAPDMRNYTAPLTVQTVQYTQQTSLD